MTAPSRNALAAAADRAADSGFDALAKGPQETRPTPRRRGRIGRPSLLAAAPPVIPRGSRPPPFTHSLYAQLVLRPSKYLHVLAAFAAVPALAGCFASGPAHSRSAEGESVSLTVWLDGGSRCWKTTESLRGAELGSISACHGGSATSASRVSGTTVVVVSECASSAVIGGPGSPLIPTDHGIFLTTVATGASSVAYSCSGDSAEHELVIP